jgi:hypothetical protein
MAIVGLVLLAAATGAQAQTKPVSFEAGIDFIGSPGLQDFTDEAYPEFDASSDLSGWLGLRAAARFNIGPYVSIVPGLSFVFHGMSVEVIGGSDPREEDYVMYLITPHVAVKGNVPVSDDIAIYAGGTLNYVVPDSTSDFFEFESGGPGIGAFLGVNVFRHAEIQVGYEYLPVDAKAKGMGKFADYDFGGVLLSIRYVL